MKIDFLIDSIAYYLFRLFAWFVRILPEPVAYSLGRVCGTLAYFVHKGKKVAYANLRAAFGPEKSAKELKRITRKMYQNIALVMVDYVRVPLLKKDTMRQVFETVGEEHLLEAQKKGKGWIYLSGHVGSWELTPHASQLAGYETAIISRIQRFPKVTGYLMKLRGWHGVEVCVRGHELKNILKALKANKGIGILTDQSGGAEGVYVDFFGRKASSYSGVIDLGVKIGCDVFPTFIQWKGTGRHQIHIYPALQMTGAREEAVEQGCAQFHKALETSIRETPDQWLWGHKKWKFCRTKRFLILSDGKAGHVAQSEAVVERLKTIFHQLDSANECSVKKVDVHFKSGFLRSLFYVLFPILSIGIQGRLKRLSWFLTPESYRAIEFEHADVVISCGSSLAGVNFCLSRENQAKSCVLMKPPASINWKKFSLVLVPEHDAAPKRRNIYRTRLTPNLVTAERLKRAAENLKSKLDLHSGPIIALILGGDTRDYQFDASAVDQLIETLKKISLKQGAQLVITTSRRTRQDIEQKLKQEFSSFPLCKYLIIANESNPTDTVYALLGLASHTIVTEDSISMISEAVSSRKPVTVLELANQAPSAKHRRFVETLQKEGFLKLAKPSELESLLSEKSSDFVSKIEAEEAGLQDRLLRAFR